MDYSISSRENFPSAKTPRELAERKLFRELFREILGGNWRKNSAMKTMRDTKQPVIRPGQRVPYQKGNRREIDRRRECVARLLAGGVRKMEIHRLIKSQFNRQWRTVDRDIQFVTQAGDGVSLRPKRA